MSIDSNDQSNCHSQLQTQISCPFCLLITPPSAKVLLIIIFIRFYALLYFRAAIYHLKRQVSSPQTTKTVSSAYGLAQKIVSRFVMLFGVDWGSLLLEQIGDRLDIDIPQLASPDSPANPALILSVVAEVSGEIHIAGDIGFNSLLPFFSLAFVGLVN